MRINNNKIWIILKDMNAKIGKKRVFKLTISSYSLHNSINNNDVSLTVLFMGKGF